jgi:hypothetical protein
VDENTKRFFWSSRFYWDTGGTYTTKFGTFVADISEVTCNATLTNIKFLQGLDASATYFDATSSQLYWLYSTDGGNSFTLRTSILDRRIWEPSPNITTLAEGSAPNYMGLSILNRTYAYWGDYKGLYVSIINSSIPLGQNRKTLYNTPPQISSQFTSLSIDPMKQVLYFFDAVNRTIYSADITLDEFSSISNIQPLITIASNVTNARSKIYLTSY